MRVLIAEDQSFVGFVLAQELTRSGVIVFGPYDTVEEVIRVTRTAKIDAAILDIVLRDGEIYPAADLLAARNVRLIFHTAHVSEHAIKQQYPRASVCTKPANTSQLVAALSDAHLSISEPTF